MFNSKFCALLVALLLSATAPQVVAATDVNQHSGANQGRVMELLEDNRFEDAEVFCTQWLDAVELASGEGSVELASPLVCLGHVYYGLDQLLKAASYFEKAIILLEQNIGVFAAELSAPLQGLGRTLSALKQYDAAISVYLRAKDTTHRNDGVFSLRQVDISNRLTELYTWAEELSAADREQRFLLHAHEENYGNTPQLTPALRHIAKWHMLMQREDLARKEYRRALAILENAYGPNDIRLAGPLSDIAESFMRTPRERRVMSGEGTKALKRIIRIYESQEFPDRADVARAWARLGDWYVRSGHRTRSRQAYLKAWQSLDALNEAPLVSDELFDAPVELEFEAHPIIDWRPSQIMRLPSGNLEIVFAFTVDESGRVRDLRVIKDEVGSNLLMTTLRANVRASRYRPQIKDGQLVATEDVLKILKYNFDDAKQEIASRKAPAEAADNNATSDTENAPELPADAPDTTSDEPQAADDSGL